MDNNDKIHILIAKAFENITSQEIEKDKLRPLKFDSFNTMHIMLFEDICFFLELAPESVDEFPDGKTVGEFIDTILPIWDGSYMEEPFASYGDLFSHDRIEDENSKQELSNNDKIHILIAKTFENITAQEIGKNELRTLTFDSSIHTHTVFFDDIWIYLELDPILVGDFPEGKKVGGFIDEILLFWDGSYMKEAFEQYGNLLSPNNDEVALKEIPSIKELKENLEYGPTADDVLKLALSSGFDIDTIDENGETLLHYFTKRCFTAMMNRCLKAGAQIDHPNNNGEQPIHFADTMESAEVLIQAGADIKALTNDGKTVLDFKPYSDFASYLEENGVSITKAN